MYPFAGLLLNHGMSYNKEYHYEVHSRFSTFDSHLQNYPQSFNTWLMFRHLVDVVLANDLICYIVFCLAHFVCKVLNRSLTDLGSS